MDLDLAPLATLQTLDGYRRGFMDPVVWRPFVERVCQGHGWTCERVRPGLAGTFPTFIVDEQRVVKFFGPRFDGETCWRVEVEAAGLVEGSATIPIAPVRAAGPLGPGWQYLVMDCVPGLSIGAVYAQLPFDDKLALASWLGTALRTMHRIAVPAESALPRLRLEQMRAWFTGRWAEERRNWPQHLAVQVEAYLEAQAGLAQGGADNFIHADLTCDHILGQVQDGHWVTRAVIDFGDALLGNIYYELAALHLDLFACDKRLLQVFLEAYGLSPGPDFAHQAMATSLLHQFGVYEPLFTWKPELQETRTLEELAERLWKIN
ncbi:MAG: aminoglycoside phosphotransferase family protein [Anaerolineales bacterium]|nr:aminoglycoside phosphotransferase family protein [Anaerolineales bacterium]